VSALVSVCFSVFILLGFPFVYVSLCFVSLLGFFGSAALRRFGLDDGGDYGDLVERSDHPKSSRANRFYFVCPA
jgi:hypothetical protein